MFKNKNKKIFVHNFTHSRKSCTVQVHFHKLNKKISKKTEKKGVSHSHLHLDGRMRIVVTDLKVLCVEIINAHHFPQDLQLRERLNLPLKLQVESDKTERKLKF